MVISSEGSSSDLGKNVSDFKERVFEIIEELTNDIDSCSEEISKQAIEHIHASEIILTIGRSRTVERFLKNAAKTCKFEVIVAEAAADFSGHQMASNLAKAKISTTIIKDSAIFAMMARANKVIIGTQSILADGTVVATSGAKTVALAAKHPDTNLRCINPLFDSLPPSLVTLYISNISGYSPSYVYRQMGDLYHHQDRNKIFNHFWSYFVEFTL